MDNFYTNPFNKTIRSKELTKFREFVTLELDLMSFKLQKAFKLFNDAKELDEELYFGNLEQDMEATIKTALERKRLQMVVRRMELSTEINCGIRILERYIAEYGLRYISDKQHLLFLNMKE